VGSAPTKLTDLYHIYLDSYGFEYKILLTRGDLTRNAISRYNLRIYESHTKPHVYCTFIQFTPPRELPPIEPNNNESSEDKYQDKHIVPIKPEPVSPPYNPTTANTKPPSPFKRLLAPPNSSFEHAFSTFRAAFQHLTFLAWEERLSPRSLIITRATAAKLEPFIYTRPKPGLPVGAKPQGPVEPISDAPAFKEMKERLVGMDVELSRKEGVIGREVARLETGKKRKEWEEKEAEERLKKEGKKKKTVVVKKENGVWVGKSTKFAKSPFYGYDH
jgi:hypothetical protein